MANSATGSGATLSLRPIQWTATGRPKVVTAMFAALDNGNSKKVRRLGGRWNVT